LAGRESSRLVSTIRPLRDEHKPVTRSFNCSQGTDAEVQLRVATATSIQEEEGLRDATSGKGAPGGAPWEATGLTP